MSMPHAIPVCQWASSADHTSSTAIAAFLDHETAKIDTLVAKKRLLLERLAEYRTALITRTVTKGLPPEAARAAGLNPKSRLKPVQAWNGWVMCRSIGPFDRSEGCSESL